MMDDTDKKLTGSVLVQGGGIAGVQASLDLANAGFKVYLVEKSPAIGGMMAHLDKTFPTGDCATCIVSPKLVECARNLNIDILTLSELESIDGEPGHFSITVKRHAGFVDPDKCTGCSECIDACPVEIPDVFNRGLGTRKAIAKYNPQAVPNVCSILKQGHAPCRMNCPAGINVQGYIQLIKKKEYLKAVQLIRERNPLSAICGRVCTHPCESSCTRSGADSPVAIRLLKRFASDREMEMLDSGEIELPDIKKPQPDAKSVAIVGGGPAGLTAADDLAGRGYTVTVYEAMPEPGGMLRWGIPDYRLPNRVLSHEIGLIRRKGVLFVCNCRIGQDVTFDELQKKHDAVFVAVGAQKSRKTGIEGEDMDGVTYGLDFLREASQDNQELSVHGKTVVIGGGNVAVDVARTALRLGADNVEMVCLEQCGEMPAYPEEIDATLKEGVTIRNGYGPKRIIGNGKVSGIEFVRCTQVFDTDGCFCPEYDEAETLTMETDRVIIAIGQAVDSGFSSSPDYQTAGGFLAADPITHATSIKGVFAGGDAVSGPTSVIDAVASGKRAAESIDRYLRGEDLTRNRFEDNLRPFPEELLPDTTKTDRHNRAVPTERNIRDRITDFGEVELGYTEEEALAECERCLNCALCSECGECVAICDQDAIDHSMGERTVTLDIGSVILAPGFNEFRAELKGEYGYGRWADVLTGVQFERMLSAAGPFEGHVVRPSDGGDVRRIAFIQCVGSRDSTCGSDYCSSVCCMAATKQAMIAMEHTPGLEATIFYMDIRAHGKDFDHYYERAKNEMGVRYIRSIPSRITRMPKTGNLRLRYIDDHGSLTDSDYDLVILSVGMKPGESIAEFASHIGIELNEHGFCATDRFAPLVTTRPGVYAAGSFQEPKDIPETVMQASAAAAMAMELLAPARHTLVTRKIYPEERDIADEEPRIGVFICHCGMNIASVVDVDRVVEIAVKQPDVVYATDTMYTCSDTSLSEIRDAVREHRLNRIVVASCTPRTHEPLFRETLREAGLNPYLFELANIRDQDSWVHSGYPEQATDKACDLVRMSIARARLLHPLKGGKLAVDHTALIIGGGLSGMTAALSLAEQGFPVHLVELTDSLGGNLRSVYYTLERTDVRDFLDDLSERVVNHPNISVYLDSTVSAVNGHIGKFNVRLDQSDGSTDIPSGAIIVATGALPAATADYLYGSSNLVLTQSELETRIHNGAYSHIGGTTVMIQCTGSRNDEHPYCSRICCSMAIKNALALKQRDPDARIYVLYRDIRTYGFREAYYTKARKAGVIFIRYDVLRPPEVTKNGLEITVVVESPDFNESIEIAADTVVLSTGLETYKDNAVLADMLKVPLNADGFFVEAHLKLRPVDFATEGIFLCGLAHSPKFMDENIAQAKAAAARAATVLSKQYLDTAAQISVVDQNRCISCMTCVKSCPYTAPYMNADHKAQIEPAKCMGCGICASECPACAIQLRHFETIQFATMLDELLAEGSL